MARGIQPFWLGAQLPVAAVRHAIDRYLDGSAPEPVRVVSACAGDGRDLLGVLARRKDAHRVRGVLLERDTGLAGRARRQSRSLPAQIDVREGDASQSAQYEGTVPADLVLLCGIFGNVSDADVRTTIAAAPQLCAPGAEVIWTRHRRHPDLTPSIRQWFAQAGFEEVAFVTPEDANERWAVGVHRLVTEPRSLQVGRQWFTFFR